MILDLVVNKTDDGYTAEVPRLKGCESWAHTEEDAINNVLDLLVFYLNLVSRKDMKIDKARGSKNRVIYKIVFDK